MAQTFSSKSRSQTAMQKKKASAKTLKKYTPEQQAEYIAKLQLERKLQKQELEHLRKEIQELKTNQRQGNVKSSKSVQQTTAMTASESSQTGIETGSISDSENSSENEDQEIDMLEEGTLNIFSVQEDIKDENSEKEDELGRELNSFLSKDSQKPPIYGYFWARLVIIMGLMSVAWNFGLEILGTPWIEIIDLMTKGWGTGFEFLCPILAAFSCWTGIEKNLLTCVDHLKYLWNHSNDSFGNTSQRNHKRNYSDSCHSIPYNPYEEFSWSYFYTYLDKSKCSCH